MSKWLLALPLAIFGVSGVGLYFYFLSQAGDGAFRENMLPELIGFCLEGFFLVGLFSFVQALRESDRRHELWLSLRGALRDFLSHLDLAFLEVDAEPASTRDLEAEPRIVHELMRQMETLELDRHSMLTLKQVAINTLPLAHDLIPVAAQLSTAHMRWWIAIVDDIKKLSEAESRDAVERPLSGMLFSLTEFDALKI